MPTTPIAPASIEPAFYDIVGETMSPFTGQQQFVVWGVGPCELSVSMPAMQQAVAEAWITFLQQLQGKANYFQFPSSFTTAYADILKSSGTARNWRLKTNKRMWRVTRGGVYHISFDCREAL